MTFDFVTPELVELKPRITVIGVGGAGSNAVANMIEDGLSGVDFVVANTDAQSLMASPAETRIQLGLKITQGLGAGARPEIGAAAAEEALEDIDQVLEGVHMAFITAGMGGGTGTGAAPVVARAARERGVLTVGVVTKPFAFEGRKRMRIAEEGIAELQKNVDTLIIIPNQNLFLIANQQTTFKQAFAMADQVLNQGVRGITDLMILPGLINLDFADVRTVMSEMGKAMMGTGEAEGEGRAIEAAEKAISNPLLDEVSLRGAKAVIINITGGDDLGLMEVEEAAQHIREMVDPDANIIVGSAFSDDLNGKMRVSVVATGIMSDEQEKPAADASRPSQSAAAAVFGAQGAMLGGGLGAGLGKAAPGVGEIPPSDDPEPPHGGGGGSGPGPDLPPSGGPGPSHLSGSDAPMQPVAAIEPDPELDNVDDDASLSDEDILELEEPVSVPEVADENDDNVIAELPFGVPEAPRAEPVAPRARSAEAAPARKPTLFERMMHLSRKPREEEVEEPIASEAEEAGLDDNETRIPPFMRRQRN